MIIASRYSANDIPIRFTQQIRNIYTRNFPQRSNTQQLDESNTKGRWLFSLFSPTIRTNDPCRTGICALTITVNPV